MSDYYKDADDDLPLFSRPVQKESPVEVLRKDPNWGKRSYRKQAVLDELRRGPKSTNDLLQVSTHRFTCDIESLRLDGWNIEAHSISEGQWLYTLKGYQPRMRPSKKMAEAYYLTHHWLSKRQRRLEFDGYKCTLCHAQKQLQVHHWVYDLFAEKLEDLQTLCDGCHGRITRITSIPFPRSVSPEIYCKLEALI